MRPSASTGAAASYCTRAAASTWRARLFSRRARRRGKGCGCECWRVAAAGDPSRRGAMPCRQQWSGGPSAAAPINQAGQASQSVGDGVLVEQHTHDARDADHQAHQRQQPAAHPACVGAARAAHRSTTMGSRAYGVQRGHASSAAAQILVGLQHSWPGAWPCASAGGGPDGLLPVQAQTARTCGSGGRRATRTAPPPPWWQAGQAE